MGAIKKPLKKLERAAKKQVRKVGYAVQGGKAKARGGPRGAAQTAGPSTAAGRGTEEEMEAVVETEGVQRRRRKKGKKQLVTPAAAIAVGGEGSSGLNIPKG